MCIKYGYLNDGLNAGSQEKTHIHSGAAIGVHRAKQLNALITNDL